MAMEVEPKSTAPINSFFISIDLQIVSFGMSRYPYRYCTVNNNTPDIDRNIIVSKGYLGKKSNADRCDVTASEWSR